MITVAVENGTLDVKVVEQKSMTAYVRMKDSAGIVNHYPNVKSIDWINGALILLTKDGDIILNSVFTCEVM